MVSFPLVLRSYLCTVGFSDAEELVSHPLQHLAALQLSTICPGSEEGNAK